METNKAFSSIRLSHKQSVLPHKFLYQDHGESCSCEGLHRLEEIRQLLPENKILFTKEKEK